MILGKFNFGNEVYIDSGVSTNQFDVYIHELVHYSITSGSLCGNLTMCLKLVMDNCEMRLRNALKELRDASIITQEMTALYGQYILKKVTEDSESLSNFEEILRSSDYYRMYCIRGFDSLIHHSKYEIDGKLLLVHLARIALNFDLTAVEGIEWLNVITIRKTLLNNPLLYNPDYRYKRLINATIQLIHENEELSFDKIIEYAGIKCVPYSYTNVYEMTKRLCRQLSEQLNIGFDELFGNIIRLLPEEDISGDVSIKDIYQSFIPKPLNGSVQYPPEGIEPLNNLVHTAITILHNHQMNCIGINTDVLCLHHSFAGWHYFVPLDRNKVIEYLNQFSGEIITFSEDYEIFRKTIELLPQKRVFYYFDGRWKLFSSFVRKNGAQNLYIHQVDSDIYCVFVTSQGQDVFLNIQTKFTLPEIISEISNGDFSYINMVAGQSIDYCFYHNDTDWCKYEDVIAAVLNINLVNPSNGVPAVGRRLQLSR